MKIPNLVVRIYETKLNYFYHSYCCLHLYCHIHILSADMFSGLLQVFEFLRGSLLNFIIQGFLTIIFKLRKPTPIIVSASMWKPSGSCRFNPDSRRVRMQEYLTLVPGYGQRNKNKRPPWFKGFRVRQETPEEGRKTHRLKRWEYNNKDEDNRPKTLIDKM